MPKRHHHTESRLNNLSVNADPEHPVYREAATEIQKRLRYMVDKHSQVWGIWSSVSLLKWKLRMTIGIFPMRYANAG